MMDTSDSAEIRFGMSEHDDNQYVKKVQEKDNFGETKTNIATRKADSIVIELLC